MDIGKILNASAIDSSELDTLVEDSASTIASRINNQGMQQQLAFLNEHYGDNKKILRYLLACNSYGPVMITTSGINNVIEPITGKLLTLEDMSVTLLTESGDSMKALYEEIAHIKFSD